MFFKRLLFIAFAFAAVPAIHAQDESFTPANPPEMKRLTNPHSPAHQAAVHFMRGINLGNYLEIPKGQDWGVRISTNDFNHIKSEGFDHVRVPIAWQEYAGPAPDFKLPDSIFTRVDFVVTNCLARGLAVMINVHHFDSFCADPSTNTEEFVALWHQIAARYATFPETLVFELINEPRDGASTPVLNQIYPRVIAEIRKTNRGRAIVVSASDWSNVSELKNLVLPADDDNLIVTIHCYEPFNFTHQGASWAGPELQITGIRFPGPPVAPITLSPTVDLKIWTRKWIENYNTQPTAKNPSSPIAFAGKLKYARDWAEYYGRPVYVGEFGAFTTADAKSRANYYREFRRKCEENNLGFALWDWSAGFHYWDPAKNQPAPGMHDAIFGK